MTQVLSQDGYVLVKTQASKGVYANPGAAAPNKGVGVRIRSGALGGTRDLMVPDPEIGGNRDVPDAKLGPIRFEGEYQMYGRLESLATFLQAALANKTDTVSTGNANDGYTHTLKPGSEQVWLSVEEQIGGGFERFKYTDMAVNTFHLEAAANGYLMMNAGLVGLTQAALGSGTAEADQRWDLSPLIVGTNVTVTRGGITLPAKSFSFDINNNIENDDFRLGSLFLGNAQLKRREVTMSVTIRPEDHGYWREAMWGSSTATSPTGLSNKDDTVIHIESYEDVAGITTPGTPYSLDITVPQSIIAPFNLSPSGDDVLQHDMEIRAVRPDPADDILTAVVVNSFATVA